MPIAREGWPLILVPLVLAVGLFLLVLSPADGKVIVAGPAPAGNPLGEGVSQVSVFLSIFDVHVNRAPIGGRISRVEYHEGQFLPAGPILTRRSKCSIALR